MDGYDSDSSLLSDDSDIKITSTVGGEEKNERKAAKKDKKIQQSIFASFYNAPEQTIFDRIPKAHEYYRSNLLEGDVGENLQIFKMCRLGNPSFMKQLRALHPGADGLTFIQHEVEKLIDIPFIDELTVKMLIKELPAYFKYADEFAGDWLFKPPTAPTTVAEVQLFKKKKNKQKVGLEILGFWEQFHGNGLQPWGEVAQKLVTYAPSSAAVKRLFSKLRLKFDSSNKNALEDYIETSMMLQSNERKLNP